MMRNRSAGSWRPATEHKKGKGDPPGAEQAAESADKITVPPVLFFDNYPDGFFNDRRINALQQNQNSV